MHAMKISDILKYYSQKELKEALLREGREREVVPRFRDGGFGKRPQTLLYVSDLEDWIRNGATSFHMSEERWLNPMMLSSDMKKQEMDSIRTGWDLVFDIDTKVFEYGKICAHLIVKALEYHDISHIYVKFSGGTGWHIAVPFETFPEKINNKQIKTLFPETARSISLYLMGMIKKKLSEEIIDYEGDLEGVCKKTGKKQKELFEGDEFNPFEVIGIDSVAISSRHLFRMVYSLNEKTWLASVPVKKSQILSFERKMAEIGNFSFELPFLERKGRKGEAKYLFSQAFDFLQKKEEKSEKGEFSIPEKAVPEKFFPPCIKKILQGMEDGRKRSVFLLATFLRLVGWNSKMIEEKIMEWNKSNQEPLRENYIKSQLKWYARNPTYLPPNCDNKGYYKDMKVCFPDNICKTIKNPVNYTFKSMKNKKKSGAGK